MRRHSERNTLRSNTPTARRPSAFAAATAEARESRRARSPLPVEQSARENRRTLLPSPRAPARRPMDAAEHARNLQWLVAHLSPAALVVAAKASGAATRSR